jgi:hypothetical protein
MKFTVFRIIQIIENLECYNLCKHKHEKEHLKFLQAQLLSLLRMIAMHK